MKSGSNYNPGDVVCILPLNYKIDNGKILLLVDDQQIEHNSTNFNVTSIGRFVVAIHPIAEGDAIQLNFNLLFNEIDSSHADPSIGLVGFNHLEESEKQSLYIYADETVCNQAVKAGFIPVGIDSCDVTKTSKGELIAISSIDCEEGNTVFTSSGVILPFSLRSTVEAPYDKHLRLAGGCEFISHSCHPNLRLDVESNQVKGIALRPIRKGEKLTYNYLCTEWEVSKVFKCSCNVYSCYGLIKGFKYLDRKQQIKLLPVCTKVVQEKYSSLLPPYVSLYSLGETNAVTLTTEGSIFSQRYIAAGSVLFTIDRFEIRANTLVVGNVFLPHSCDANTVLLEGRLVTSRPLVAGDSLTFNLNMVSYELPTPFSCTCGYVGCKKEVKGFKRLSDEEKNRLIVFTQSEVHEQALREGFDIQTPNPLVEIRITDIIGPVPFARTLIKSGERIFHTDGLVIPFPTIYTIYLGDGKHLLFSGGPQTLSHSCEPNTRIIVDPDNGCFDCIAITDIQKGESISFNYLTTEWNMNSSFQCCCQKPSCLGKIKGFMHLSNEDKQRLWPQTTMAVRSLYAQEDRSVLSTLNHDLITHCNASGVLCVARDLPSGTVLFQPRNAFTLIGNKVGWGDVALRHACDATAAMIGGRIVLIESVDAGAEITINVNLLYHSIPHGGFDCACDQLHCVRHISGFSALSEQDQARLFIYAQPSVRMEALANGFPTPCASDIVSIRAHEKIGQATFAAKSIKGGTRFLKNHGILLPFSTPDTMLIKPGCYLLSNTGAQCLAHSCNPNIRIMVDEANCSWDCLALRDIKEGEIIAFNYNTTEWNLAEPFLCLCGAPNCSGKIRGFKHLGNLARQNLWYLITPALRTLGSESLSENWTKLSSSQLNVNSEGRVQAAQDIKAGTPVLSAAQLEVVDGHVFVEGVRLRHHCLSNASIIEHFVVLTRAVCRAEEITINLNCLEYELEKPFLCHCNAKSEPHMVHGFKGLSEDQKRAQIIYAEPPVRVAATDNGYKIPCGSPLVEIKSCGDIGQATFAKCAIRAGTRFLQVKGLCLPFPTVYTVLLDEGKHLLFAEGAQCLAHSCNPNVQICVDGINNTLECEALRDIDAGEIIAFNYLCTEWDMNTPFTCQCHSDRCFFDIRGFKYLSKIQREALLPSVTPAIRQLAGVYSDIHIPSGLVRANDTGLLVCEREIPKGTILVEVSYLDIHPSQISVGKRYTINHSDSFNCVLVEGRIISNTVLQAHEVITVNMNFFVYDMSHIIPRACAENSRGFKYLPENLKQRMLYLCEPPVRAQAMRDGWIVKSTSDLLIVRPNGEMGQTAYALRDIPSGTTLFHCSGLVIPFPTMYTICVGPRRHLLFGDAAECIAHHCDPNVKVQVNDDETIDFVTVKNISSGEMVTFNYNTTEWAMNSQFVCLCGSPLCAKLIRGYRFLSDKDRQRLWPLASSVVKGYCA